jgi:hypothetical protein
MHDDPTTGHTITPAPKVGEAPELTVRGYLAALEDSSRVPCAPVTRTMPLFPNLEATLRADAVVLRNSGDFTIRARSYGQPGYRLMMLVFDGQTVIDDRWVELPRDLRPGDAAEVALPRVAGKLRLYHAIEGIPMVEAVPFAEFVWSSDARSTAGERNVEC